MSRNISPLDEDEGFDEEGLITPLELVTPEDRAGWKEEHLVKLLTDYGMTKEEAQLHIALAKELTDD